MSDTPHTHYNTHTRYVVEDLQACEPSSLPHVRDITVTFTDETDSMGFDRVNVEGPNRAAVAEYVRDNWGDDEATGGWFSEYVLDRIRPVEMSPDTLGTSSGNPDLNMPRFVVEIVDAQGNGDVTDAVITLRGNINNAPDMVDREWTQPFVAVDWEEAETVAEALYARAEETDDIDLEYFDGDRDEAVSYLRHLAKRFEMVRKETQS